MDGRAYTMLGGAEVAKRFTFRMVGNDAAAEEKAKRLVCALPIPDATRKQTFMSMPGGDRVQVYVALDRSRASAAVRAVTKRLGEAFRKAARGVELVINGYDSFVAIGWTELAAVRWHRTGVTTTLHEEALASLAIDKTKVDEHTAV